LKRKQKAGGGDDDGGGDEGEQRSSGGGGGGAGNAEYNTDDVWASSDEEADERNLREAAGLVSIFSFVLSSEKYAVTPE
jgi:hypothetical protein